MKWKYAARTKIYKISVTNLVSSQDCLGTRTLLPESTVFPLSLPGASFPALSLFFAVLPFYRDGLCLTVRCIFVPGFGACLALRFEIRFGSLCVSAPLAFCFGKYRDGCTVAITVRSACIASWYLTYPHRKYTLSYV